MARLEEIVQILEKNEKPLDETISLFEEGLIWCRKVMKWNFFWAAEKRRLSSPIQIWRQNMAEKEKTFEESMARLEEIVQILEKNEKPLDETISLFEEGLKLVKTCDARLKSFETRIEEITAADHEEE